MLLYFKNIIEYYYGIKIFMIKIFCIHNNWLIILDSDSRIQKIKISLFGTFHMLKYFYLYYHSPCAGLLD